MGPIADDPAALTALAMQQRAEGDLDCALENFRRALAMAPDSRIARLNLAVAMDDAGETPGALNLLEDCRDLIAQSPQARWLAAVPVLRSGDYGRGFAWYEARWQSGAPTFAPPTFKQPRWRGEAGSGTLLLWAEQGLGDSVQFIRFARDAAARGWGVLAQLPPALVSLAKGVPGVREVVESGAALPPFDTHLPLMSLPHVLGMRLDNLAGGAYLHAPAERAAKWAALLPDTRKRRIGLVWRSTIYRDDAMVMQSKLGKSLPLTMLAPLLRLPDVETVSLQVGHGSEEVASLARDLRITDPTAHVDDLADTAAAIGRLDLVVTIDTVVAHLAGALGKPVFVLLNHSSCWRWLTGRDDSPWYDSARLFRQATRNDWREPVAAASRAAWAMLPPSRDRSLLGRLLGGRGSG